MIPGIVASGGAGGSADDLYNLVSSLLHFGGADASTAFTDQKGNTWTAVGNAQLDDGDLLLDGSGDYIEASNTAFAFGTGDFTIECEVELSILSGNRFAFTFGGGWGVYRLSSTGRWGVFDGLSSNPITSTVSPNLNTRYHVMLTRNGTTMRLFIDGTQVGSVTNSTDFTNNTIRIGAQPSGEGALAGRINEFRVTNAAREVSNFTPPADPYPNRFGDPYFENVISLNHWDGSNGSTSFVDQISGRTWTNGADGGALSTISPRFGSAALEFSGSGNNQVNSDSGADWGFGTGDFTIEWWQFLPSVAGTIMLWDQRGAGNAVPCIFQQSGNLLYYVNGGVRITGTSPLVAGAWQHLAVSRVSGNTRLFHNGIQLGSAYVDSVNYVANRVRLGTNGDTSGGFGTLTGKYDDVRVTKGVGRYSRNFVPLPVEFANAA